MKLHRHLRALLCALATLSAMPSIAQQIVRTDSLINFDWKFTTGDTPNAKNVAFNDKAWATVQLPHDGSIAGPPDTVMGTRRNGFRPRHIGWYRKVLTVPASAAGKLIVLDFEGVYRAAEVWVNSVYLGKHLNGYSGFSYNITKHITPVSLQP